jgi:hypothetical protein
VNSTAESSAQHGSRRSFAVNITVNMVLPYLTYRVLTGHGFADLTALTIGAIFPAALAVIELLAHRSLDILALLSLCTLAIGIVGSEITGDARLAIAKDSLFTGGFGIVLLASLLAARPLMFFFGRKFGARHDPVAEARWDDSWRKSPNFRRTMRLTTALWGGVFLLEAAVRVVVAYSVPVPTAAAFSQTSSVVVLGALIFLTIVSVRRSSPITRREVEDYDSASVAPNPRL